MARLLRGIAWLACLLILFVVAAECASYVANFRAASRAKGLLRDVSAMKLGITTDEEVQRIVRRYGGNVGSRFGMERCESFAPRWVPYTVDVESKVLNSLGERDLLHGTALRHFGASMWRVSASFGIDDRGRLSCVEYQVRSEPVDSDFVRVSAIYSLPYSASDTTAYDVGFRDVHYVRNLSAAATTNASVEQQERIFDFDLDCLARIGGCRAVCEIMPSAWLDYYRTVRENSSAVPAGELNDPQCESL
jgi:hypothetical protein